MMARTRNVLVTGGAGFIGSHLVDVLLEQGHRVVVLDLLTYAGSLNHLRDASNSPDFTFMSGDICDAALVRSILAEHSIEWVAHLAAETHVDNSIDKPAEFIRTNILGTYQMLQAALDHWRIGAKDFRFLHVSTDEVFGELDETAPPFNEHSPYRPNSPYSASKAAADHMVRAWARTYGLPVIVTNCSNNFGPRQHIEKLIPTMIAAAYREAPLPVYGNGSNVRDWLYVRDHCEGLALTLSYGKIGETYCFGGECQLSNIELVRQLCNILDELRPRKTGASFADLITFVADRPGHDWRYAINCDKAKIELGFTPRFTFESALRKTAHWYLKQFDNAANTNAQSRLELHQFERIVDNAETSNNLVSSNDS